MNKTTDKSVIQKYLFFTLPYLIFLFQLFTLDLCARSIDFTENAYSLFDTLPNLFTLSFALLFIGILIAAPSKFKKIVYIILIVIFTLLSLTHMIYYLQVNFAFSFQIIGMASDGTSYFTDSILRFCKIRPIHLIAILIVIFFSVINFFLLGKNQSRFNLKAFWTCTFAAIILNYLCLWGSGMFIPSSDIQPENNEYQARVCDVFNKFEERYLCLKIGGFYEYLLRDITTAPINIDESINDEEKQFLSTHFSDDLNDHNSFTGIFKGKNVIFLQLEGVDDWLLTQETTPNLYNLKQNSIDFYNHYTMLAGAGSTINNEMAVNTGYYMPFCAAISKASYYLDNDFNLTLPKSFRAINYNSNMFHFNNGDFYDRQKIAKHIGYENYYGLKDIVDDSNELELDRWLIDNSDFYGAMFHQSQPFMNYLITYTPHLPYAYTGKGKILVDENGLTTQVDQLSEADFLKLDIQETDNMVGKLVQALKDNNLYDNTVIVAFADHSQYGMIDQPEIQAKCSGIPDLANHTPFFIWSSDISPIKVDKISMQADIMPTVLNLFGIDFNKSLIIGHDVFDNKYPSVAVFKNRSYFDGTYYFKNGISFIKDNEKDLFCPTDYTNDVLKDYVDTIIRKNDLVVTGNYFKYKSSL